MDVHLTDKINLVMVNFIDCLVFEGLVDSGVSLTLSHLKGYGLCIANNML
ncbi:MAG: hypothetical protein ACI9VT_003649 [Psychroserpens sp.]|jgi:hypothetical protein